MSLNNWHKSVKRIFERLMFYFIFLSLWHLVISSPKIILTIPKRDVFVDKSFTSSNNYSFHRAESLLFPPYSKCKDKVTLRQIYLPIGATLWNKLLHKYFLDHKYINLIMSRLHLYTYSSSPLFFHLLLH